MLLPAIRLASGRALDVSLRYSTPTTKAPGVAAIGTVNGRSPVTKPPVTNRSEEHTSELQSLMRISYAVFCLKKKKTNPHNTHITTNTNYITPLISCHTSITIYIYP